MKQRLRKITEAIAVLAMLCSSTAAIADDACTIIAQQGLFDTQVEKTSTQSFASFRQDYCNWYDSYHQRHLNDNADVKIAIVDLPVGLSNSLTIGEADALHSGLCSSTTSSNFDQGSYEKVSRFINPTVMTAFNDCIAATRAGLSIIPKINDDETMADISISYHAPDSAKPYTTVTSIDVKGWDCSKPKVRGVIDITDFIGKEDKLTNNQVGMFCVRDVKSTPFEKNGAKLVADEASISIRTYAGGYTRFFRPKFYRDPIADTAKVMASYPKGTILPFAGHLADIPVGWHICDGTAGTIKLIDHFPFGAETDAQVDNALRGQTEGSASEAITASLSYAPNINVTQGDKGPALIGTDARVVISQSPPPPYNNIPPAVRVFFIQKITEANAISPNQ